MWYWKMWMVKGAITESWSMWFSLLVPFGMPASRIEEAWLDGQARLRGEVHEIARSRRDSSHWDPLGLYHTIYTGSDEDGLGGEACLNELISGFEISHFFKFLHISSQRFCSVRVVVRCSAVWFLPREWRYFAVVYTIVGICLLVYFRLMTLFIVYLMFGLGKRKNTSFPDQFCQEVNVCTPDL